MCVCVKLGCGLLYLCVHCRQLESEGNNCTKLHQQLEKVSQDLEASLADLEANRISNLLLKQQVSLSVIEGRGRGKEREREGERERGRGREIR